MVQAGSKYTLRAHRRATGDVLSVDVLKHPSSSATIAAGLRPGILTLPAEKKKYSGNRSEYLEARDFVLSCWHQDRTTFLTEEACLKSAPDSRRKMVKEVYRFLQLQGCINFGILKNDPHIPLPEDFFLPQQQQQKEEEQKEEEEKEGKEHAGQTDTNNDMIVEEQQQHTINNDAPNAPIDNNNNNNKGGDEDKDATTPPPPPELTDTSLLEKLYEIVSTSDLETTSEKMIRAALAAHFHDEAGIKARKAQIRDVLTAYLEASPEQREERIRQASTGDTTTTQIAGNNTTTTTTGAAATTTTATNLPGTSQRSTTTAATKPPKSRKTLGRVIVIGAGPAGLTAALHLKRNNVDVTVLEARDRVGGRVNSHKAPGFQAPVDLGASIITGVEADSRRGLRADPSSLLCMQLGIQLHQLGDVLPLYDVKSGMLADPVLDREAEKIRDEVMDDAAAILENLDENEAKNASFGGLLDRAISEWEERLKRKIEEAQREEEEEQEAIDEGIPSKKEEESSSLKKVEDAGTAIPTTDHPSNKHMDTSSTLPHADSTHILEDDTTTVATTVPTVAIDTNTTKGKEEKEEENTKPIIDIATTTTTTTRDTQIPVATTTTTTTITTTPVQRLQSLPPSLSPAHLHLLNWHWANLEYGCSAPLSALSAEHWNQDEDYGGFGGPHCMVVGGYDQIFKRLSTLVDVKTLSPVSVVRMQSSVDKVEVVTSQGTSYWADAVVVAVPLGVLKAQSIAFEPALPAWKQNSIEKLGFGDLNKIILQFPEVFWDDTVDFFGAAAGSNPIDRGWCFMFWNFHRFAKVPILAALVSGDAARHAENLTQEDLQAKTMEILRSLYPTKNIPDPIACTVSRWASEEYSKGSYSFVGVGATGDDYDQLAKPVSRRILFAGEHTIKEHPDTVGGAMMSGTREAARALEILADDAKEGANTAEDVGNAVAALKEGKKDKSSLKRGREHEQHTEKKKNKNKGMMKNGFDDDDDIDDDDLERKFDRAIMGRDVARMNEEMRARQASRSIAKEVWMGLLDAEIGKTQSICEIMRSLTTHFGSDDDDNDDDDDNSSKKKRMDRKSMNAIDIESRQVTAAGCLTQASQKAKNALSRDMQCIKLLVEWIEDSCRDGGGRLVAVTDGALKALLALNIDADVAKKSGAERVVRQRCALHGDGDVRKCAVQLLKGWSKGMEINEGGTTLNNNNNEQNGAVTSAPIVPIELDEETKKILEDAEEEAKKLRNVAETLKIQAQNHMDEAMNIHAAAAAANNSNGNNNGGPSHFSSAMENKKHRKTTSTGDLMNFEQYKSLSESMKRKPKAKMERLSEKKVTLQETGTHNNNKDKPFDLNKKLDVLISGHLLPYFNNRSITKDEYKSILKKSREKVISRMTQEDLQDGRKYVSGHKSDILKLVDAYIKNKVAMKK